MAGGDSQNASYKKVIICNRTRVGHCPKKIGRQREENGENRVAGEKFKRGAQERYQNSRNPLVGYKEKKETRLPIESLWRDGRLFQNGGGGGELHISTIDTLKQFLLGN